MFERWALENLIDLLEERTFKPGEAIFNEGELGRTMYVLREGEVEVSRRSMGGKMTVIVVPCSTAIIDIRWITCRQSISMISTHNIMIGRLKCPKRNIFSP